MSTSSSARRFAVVVVPGGYSVRLSSDGTEVLHAVHDPLAAVVRAAEQAGLPDMRVLFNREDDPPAVGPIIEMEASEGGDGARGANPVEQRRMARERKAARGSRGMAPGADARPGPGEFPDRVRTVVPHRPTKFTAEQEAMYSKVYGAYWRSPQMAADCQRLYGGRDNGWWGRRLDDRIAQAWADVAAAASSGASRHQRKLKTSTSGASRDLQHRHGQDDFSASELFRECIRLAPHSRRLRALGRVWEREGFSSVPIDQLGAVNRLLADIRIRIGEPVTPAVYWDPGRIPLNLPDALMFLQRPEVFDSEHYAGMLMHAVWPPLGVGHPRLRRFAERLVTLAQDRLVPAFVELAWVPHDVQAAGFVRGRTPITPGLSNHVAGRAVHIGHAAEDHWPGLTATWLNVLAQLAAADVGVYVGFGSAVPGQFILTDADGVPSDGFVREPLLSEVGSRRFGDEIPGEGYAQRSSRLAAEARRMSGRSHGGEKVSLLRWYSGEAREAPWNTATTVQSMVGMSGRPLPDSSGEAVVYDCRRNPATGKWQVCEIGADGIPRWPGADGGFVREDLPP